MQSETESARPNWGWTIPNILCLIRLFGSPVMIVCAWADATTPLLILLVILLFTDWFDGKIARWFHQETVYGAKLDSLADATFYACTLISTLYVHYDAIRSEMFLIGSAIACYAVNITAGIWKFGRWPSYHTRLAKTSWWLVGIAVIVLFANGPIWPLRIVFVIGIVANLEETAITFILRQHRVNVLTFFQALRERRATLAAERTAEDSASLGNLPEE